MLKNEKIQILEKLKNIDFDKLIEDEYNRNKEDPNNLSFWFSKIQYLIDYFIIPKTTIINIPLSIYKILIKDSWTKQDEETIEKYFPLVNSDKAYFIKSGNFSGKFDFDKCCKCTDTKNVKYNIRHIYYNSSLVGCPTSPELVIREFLETDNSRPTIYNGLKLNTEFRVFYNFDTKKILGIFNYWDKETMIQGLQFSPKDLPIFSSVANELEEEFEHEKKYLEEKCNKAFIDVDLHGAWSIDFMLIKEHTFALIDMATAETSYYAEKLNNL